MVVNGDTWSTQTREITIYPQRHGEYYIPEISVEISINAENNIIVEGVAETNPQRFIVSLPDALADIEHFIVSPQVKLEVLTDESDNKSNNYSVGSAITKIITITAESAPAMMIPPLKQDELPGLSIYQKTPQVFDKSNRGELLGTRIETVTYIFEKEGLYEIPEQIIFWWDSNQSKLQEITIPSQTYSVGKNKIGNDNNTKNNAFGVNSKILFWLSIIVFTVGLFFILTRHKHNIKKLYASITNLEQRKIKKAYIHAISNHKYRDAINYLYQYAMLIDVEFDRLNSDEFVSLNQLAFDHKSHAHVFSTKSAKILLAGLSASQKGYSEAFDNKKKITINNQ
jgi:hypothetical protein